MLYHVCADVNEFRLGEEPLLAIKILRTVVPKLFLHEMSRRGCRIGSLF